MNDLSVNGEVTATSLTCTNLICDTMNGNVYAKTVTARSEVNAIINGNMNGNIDGDMTGNINGSITGNVAGDINGNVIGNITGSLGQYKGEDLLFNG